MKQQLIKIIKEVIVFLDTKTILCKCADDNTVLATKKFYSCSCLDKKCKHVEALKELLKAYLEKNSELLKMFKIKKKNCMLILTKRARV